MAIADTYRARNQTRHYDQIKIPSKEQIEEILSETYDLVMSKQNLMPYKVHVLGPEHREIKEQIYILSTEVEYPDEQLRNKWRLNRFRIHEEHFEVQKRFPPGNSQLFAPYLVFFEARRPNPNPLVQRYMDGEGEMDYRDIRAYDNGQSKLEIGMFAALMSGVVVDKGLNCSFTGCINPVKMAEIFDWVEVPPLLSMSIGYPHPLIDDKYLYNKVMYKDKGEDKPHPEDVFNWI